VLSNTPAQRRSGGEQLPGYSIAAQKTRGGEPPRYGQHTIKGNQRARHVQPSHKKFTQLRRVRVAAPITIPSPWEPRQRKPSSRQRHNGDATTRSPHIYGNAWLAAEFAPARLDRPHWVSGFRRVGLTKLDANREASCTDGGNGNCTFIPHVRERAIGAFTKVGQGGSHLGVANAASSNREHARRLTRRAYRVD
jgi:hypothetical protein